MTNLIVALLCFVMSESPAQKVTVKDVPNVVKSAFIKAVPNAKAKKSEKEHNNFEAEYLLNKVEYAILFSSDRTVVESEMKISHSELPSFILDYLIHNEPKAKVLDVTRITDAKGIVSFEVDFKISDLIFIPDGSNFIVASEEETNND